MFNFARVLNLGVDSLDHHSALFLGISKTSYIAKRRPFYIFIKFGSRKKNILLLSFSWTGLVDKISKLGLLIVGKHGRGGSYKSNFNKDVIMSP